MKMLFLLAALLLLSSPRLVAQVNLVRNPSFEEKNTCNLDSMVGIDTTWFENSYLYKKTTFWISPNKETPDYFNPCATNTTYFQIPHNFAGYQFARTGVAYSGIGAYFSGKFEPQATGEPREYLQTKLINKLESRSIYCAKFYASPTFSDLDGYNKILIRNLGIFLSNSPPRNNNLPFLTDETSHTVILLTPQIEYKGPIVKDTSAWFPVEGLYKANGSEEWMTLGNFRELAKTDTAVFAKYTTPTSSWAFLSYYYIDDVSVVKVSDPIFSSRDTAVCSFPFLLTAISGFESYLWSTGETTQSITINQPGQYWVKADMGECGSVYDTINVTQRPMLVMNIPDQMRCSAELPVQISATAGFDSYHWSSGETASFVTIDKAGSYQVSATYPCGTITDEFKVELKAEVPPFDLGEAIDICENHQTVPAHLAPSASLPNYSWSTGETTPEITVDHPGIYWLASQTECNNRSDSIRVDGCPIQIYVPNAFSPNDDGENDIFMIYGTGFEDAVLSIFDRWGELVFEGDAEKGWDGRFRGRPAPEGVYAYRLVYKEPISGEVFEKDGDLTVLR